MNQIIYSQGAILAVSFVQQKHLRFTRQTPVLLCVIVQWVFPRDGPLAVDLVWTVRKLFLWLILKLRLWFEVLFYTRAAASDYDDWENVYGNKGWGSKHLIPLLKKVRALRSTHEITMVIFIGRNIPTSYNELYSWKIRTDQSVVSRTTLEHLQKFSICCWEIW